MIMDAVQSIFLDCGNGHMLSLWSPSAMYLDNRIKADCMLMEENDMAYKIKRSVVIDGKQRWVTANSEQEYAEKLSKLFGASYSSMRSVPSHNFKQYALNWFELYSKPNIATATQKTYSRQLNLYLIPAFGDKAIEEITTDDVQKLFNGMAGAKATKEKVRLVLNMILDTAVDDGYIAKNPARSKKIKVCGKSSEYTECYSVEQMHYLIQNLSSIKNPTDRAFLAIQALHPLRLEEVLGLQWKDIDLENMRLHINKAVTHPDRNQPEIKEPKTEASKRVIELSSIAAAHLSPSGNQSDFVIGGEVPLSYTQVRKMCKRIQKDIAFEESITPIRFRTTVLSDIYADSKDVKLAQAAAGHTTAAMTLERYIKRRDHVVKTASVIDRVYSSNPQKSSDIISQ